MREDKHKKILATTGPHLVHSTPPQTPADQRSHSSPIASSTCTSLSYGMLTIKHYEDLEAQLRGLDPPGPLPAKCLWEVLRRLPPVGLLMASRVCKGWRETTRRLWPSIEEITLPVPSRTPSDFVESLLQKCHVLKSLTMHMNSDLEPKLLECIGLACPHLRSVDIRVDANCNNRITGYDLGFFVHKETNLRSLKMGQCLGFGGVVLYSSSLKVLRLSGLSGPSPVVLHCPNLIKISLLAKRPNDTTDFPAIIEDLGKNCPLLQSMKLKWNNFSDKAVAALAQANFSELKELTINSGTAMDDACVTVIASSYPKLELLDLSRSMITVAGIIAIGNRLIGNLSQLRLKRCPNVTRYGIELAVSVLPHLKHLNCESTIIHDPAGVSSNMLTITHRRLETFSLMHCSGLDELYLRCISLKHLNLRGCTKLRSDRCVLSCPRLEEVQVSDGCVTLIEALKDHVKFRTLGRNCSVNCLPDPH